MKFLANTHTDSSHVYIPVGIATKVAYIPSPAVEELDPTAQIACMLHIPLQSHVYTIWSTSHTATFTGSTHKY